MIRTKYASPGAAGLGRIALPVVAIIILSVGFMIWSLFIEPGMRHDDLVEHGIRAPGRLISVDETGTVINGSPKLELVVELTRKDGVLDTVVTYFTPSRRTLHLFQSGVPITAAYDPEDPDEVTVVSFGGALPLTTVPASEISRHLGNAIQLTDSLRRVTDSLAREIEALKAKSGEN